MPDHIRFLLKHALIGVAAAVSFVGLLLWFNVMNLWYLVSHTAEGPLALGVMTVFFIITFASVQMGIAVMALGESDEDDDGPRGNVPELAVLPVRVSDHR